MQSRDGWSVHAEDVEEMVTGPTLTITFRLEEGISVEWSGGEARLVDWIEAHDEYADVVRAALAARAEDLLRWMEAFDARRGAS